MKSSKKTLTKRELVLRISAETNLKQADVMDVLQMTLDVITDELAKGNNIEFRNFGVFEVLCRKARLGRNPNNAKVTVQIPARAVVKFKPGKEMKQQVLKLDPKAL